MEIFLCVCWVTFFLVIWFETDAFVHYCKLFKLDLAFGVVEYEQDMSFEGMDYLDYLRIKYPDSFIISLITCPMCISVWMSVAFIFGSGVSYVYIAVVNLLALLFYFIIKRLFN